MSNIVDSPSQSCMWKNEFGGEDHRYYIKSDLLANCIGYGHAASVRPDEMAGFSWSKDSFGYVLLGYLAERAMEFRRLPFCMDRIEHWAFSQQEIYRSAILEQLSEENISEAVEELREVYAHTQRKLREQNLSEVRLTRQIRRNDGITYSSCKPGYAETLMKIKDAAELLGHEVVEFEMDTLNSFGGKGCYPHWADVTIEHVINAEDILYCAALVGREGVSGFTESGEWVVLNKSPTGMVKIPTSSIYYDKKRWHDILPLKTKEDAERVLRDNKLPLRGRTYYKSSYGTHGKRPSLRQRIAEYLLR